MNHHQHVEYSYHILCEKYGYNWFNLGSNSPTSDQIVSSISCTSFTSREDLEIEISLSVVSHRSTPPPFFVGGNCMKHFSEIAFQNDVDSIPFQVCDIFDDIDDVYWMHDKLLMSELDKHVAVKTKTVNIRFHIRTLHCEKPLIKEICGVANILETATISNSEWNMFCGGIMW